MDNEKNYFFQPGDMSGAGNASKGSSVEGKKETNQSSSGGKLRMSSDFNNESSSYGASVTPPSSRPVTPPPSRLVTPSPSRPVTPPPSRPVTPPPSRSVTPPNIPSVNINVNTSKLIKCILGIAIAILSFFPIIEVTGWVEMKFTISVLMETLSSGEMDEADSMLVAATVIIMLLAVVYLFRVFQCYQGETKTGFDTTAIAEVCVFIFVMFLIEAQNKAISEEAWGLGSYVVQVKATATYITMVIMSVILGIFDRVVKAND